MHVAFLTPLAALAVLLALPPLCAWLFLVRRDAVARRLLSLPAPLRSSRLGPAFAIVVAAALIGIAAAQPVIQQLKRTICDRRRYAAVVRFRDRAGDAGQGVRVASQRNGLPDGVFIVHRIDRGSLRSPSASRR